MEWREIIALGSMAIALAALLLNILDRSKGRIKELRSEWEQADDKMSVEIQELEDELSKLNADLEVVKAQVAVFWRGVAFNSAALLHSPHTPEFDLLLERFLQDRLDAAGLVELKGYLFAVANDDAETPMRRYLAHELLLALHLQAHYGLQSEASLPYFELIDRHALWMKREHHAS